MNLNQCYGSLKEGYEYWRDFFANRRFCIHGNEVVWYQPQLNRTALRITAYDFGTICDSGQYSFQLIEDGSIVRLWYRFDRRGREVEAASLSLIRPPSTDKLSYVEGQRVADQLNGVCDWFRIDFDPNVNCIPGHAACHIHFSDMANARIPLSRLPTPKQFIAWVISLVYPEVHTERLGDKLDDANAINAPCFMGEQRDRLAAFFYLNIPPVPVEQNL